MKLATKLTVAVSAVFAVVLVITSFFIATDELAFVDEEMDLHGRLLGRVVASSVEETWTEAGEARARELVRTIDQHEPEIAVRWIDLDGGAVRGLSPELQARLRAGEVVGRVSPVDDDTLYTYVPIARDGETARVVQIAESLDEGIVADHGGWIDVRTAAGEGTRFSVYLPRSG